MSHAPRSTVRSSHGAPSGLSKINAWVDDSSNNTAKRYYGGDMLGNLWRFDFEDLVAPAGTEVTKLATFQISPGAPQPISTKPQLTVVTASGGTKVPVVVEIKALRFIVSLDLPILIGGSYVEA